MGVTYEAEPLHGGPRVALKELHLARVDDWKVVDLFEREARVLAAVTHPAVPAYVAHFSVEGASGPAFYLAQQLAPGRSLADWVAGGWRADEAEARRIAAALLDVLDYLHARVPPVYHRDIKPQNVLLEDSGKIWLVDFGAVRDVYRSATMGGSTVAGTLGYMAPEQLRGVARPESDLHGLGATLLYVLSGQSPADMPQSKLKIDFRKRVVVSAPFAAWLDKVLEPAPEDRFRSAQAALRALTDGESTPGRPSKRTLTVAASLGVVGLMAGSLLAFVDRREAGTKWAPTAVAKLFESPAATCDFGSVVGDVFGRPVDFDDGRDVPAGRYRVTYVDGCMKYSGTEDWTVHASGLTGPGHAYFWIVGGVTRDKIAAPPGTVGVKAGAGGFASFDACVAANRSLAPIEFDFAGGKIGIWLEDSPYGDNLPGRGGRNPQWRLTSANCEPDRRTTR
jgi:hypothetical protein